MTMSDNDKLMTTHDNRLPHSACVMSILPPVAKILLNTVITFAKIFLLLIGFDLFYLIKMITFAVTNFCPGPQGPGLGTKAIEQWF